MRILVLSKRQYLGKDLLDDRFFRNFEIPEALAARGHVVQGVALSYRPRAQGIFQHSRVEWASINAIPCFSKYLQLLSRKIKNFRPDIIWASSDAFHAMIAWRYCSRFNIPFVIDLYDNYESFGASRIPGVVPLLRTACRHAAGITVVSHSLDRFVIDQYGVQCPVRVVTNAIRKDIFFPRHKRDARKALGLPENAKLIGTAGAISAGRGIGALFEAFLRLAVDHQDLWLVYAGPRDETPCNYPHERIIDLGTLGLAEVSQVFNAIDVAVICNIDSPFGRYCFPQKLYEIVACGTPLVAAAVGDMADLLASWPQSLYAPGSVDALEAGLLAQLTNPVAVSLDVPDWMHAAAQVEDLCYRALA